MVKGLAEEKLTQLADRVRLRILQSAPVTEEECTECAAKQEQKYKMFVESKSSFYQEFLQESGESFFVLACQTYESWF